LARAILFDLTSAPPATATAWPEQIMNVTYGDTIQLVGYDIPGGTIRAPGDVLPVSLLWHALDTVPQNYTVALFVMAEDGTLIAQQDAFPAYNFEPMTTWRADSLHRDNHGLQLPSDLAPGTYELWAALYHWQTPDERLPVTDATGAELGSYAVLATITIQP
ncbi:MAG: hypothetical protein JXA10_12950, partial [Anaerolineae bacterium]|nr:hypothetical protein [Anaerolineae bacterium]